jgi:RNA recognition motif-containing protein
MLGKRGSLMLFVRGLPKGVTRKELKQLIQSAVNQLDKRPFSLKAAVSNCSILCISQPHEGASEYHGLVEIQPAKVAIEAIRVLNGMEFRGQKLEVRRYQHRSLLRDQRCAQDHDREEATGGIRERRRQNLKIDLARA